MRYWWVNQNQTYKHEVRGGFMWSPKRRADGSRNQFYDYMREVSPGDIVFSYCETRIKAIGVVIGRAQTGPKPDFGSAGLNRSEEGWFVPVDYCRLDEQIRPMDHMQVLRPFLPARYSPLLPDGRGLQSVYLTEVPDALADALIGLIGDAFWAARNEIEHVQNPRTAELDDVTAEQMVLGPTFKEQVVRARRGQGVFRANVMLNEEHCRVTKVTERCHLVASHIKPWRDASDAERLDGANGLLLSPHIDHLFDEGYITFTAGRRLLVVPEVRDKLVNAWGIDPAVDVGGFRPAQRTYLDYHYANVFRRDLVDD